MKSSAKDRSEKALDEWLSSCTRHKRISRNTIAIGVVVLDHIRRRGIVARDEVVSQGGEISGARSGLGNVLESYDIPRSLLKEVTTRQSHQDGQRLFEALSWGKLFSGLATTERETTLLLMIGRLKQLAQEWLNRQNLKLEIDRRQSPTTWINIIVESAKGHSGGVVEQHLVGAKLSRRFGDFEIPNHPAHAADVQTDRLGDFSVAKLVYHVTAAPSRAVLAKCRSNLRAGHSPILLVPRSQETKTRILAQDEGIDKELTIITIEDFVAINIIEIATVEHKDFFAILKEIVSIYNERLAEVETDVSLRIDVK